RIRRLPANFWLPLGEKEKPRRRRGHRAEIGVEGSLAARRIRSAPVRRAPAKPSALCALCGSAALSLPLERERGVGYSTLAPAVGAAAVAVFVDDAVAFAPLVPATSASSDPSPRSSMSEIGALSPRRGPNLTMRVYPPGRVAKRRERSSSTFSTRSTRLVAPPVSTRTPKRGM